ncbi:MAG: hypothetical protein K2Q14_04520 [Gammaproteobacteria bacterium]|nr:hypothetical protein [Gammaproteobacteria bacterium]
MPLIDEKYKELIEKTEGQVRENLQQSYTNFSILVEGEPESNLFKIIDPLVEHCTRPEQLINLLASVTEPFRVSKVNYFNSQSMNKGKLSQQEHFNQLSERFQKSKLIETTFPSYFVKLFLTREDDIAFQPIFGFISVKPPFSRKLINCYR